MKKIKIVILITLITNAISSYSQCALYTFKSNYNAVCANDQVILTAIATQPNYGNGSDGALTVSASTTVNTVQSAVAGVIGTAGSYSIAVANATGFAVGKEILIISMQDSTQSIANTVGLYEFKTITSISSNTITFSQPLTNTYLATTYFKHQVILVPNYTNVTVNSGGILTCNTWNGATGGVLIFRVSGNLIINTGGIISASQKGYRGIGHPAIYRNYNGAQGEGIYGQGYIGAASSGANGYWNFPNGNGGGGATGTGDAGGGGGGSYGTLGTVGVNSGVHNKGLAGKLVGDSAVARLYFGGAGGEGGADEDGGAPGKGGNGGGIIYIGAGSITNNGTIVSNGEAGGNGGNTGGGGGGGMGGGAGGAGGTIQLGLNSFSGTGTNITVNGGALGTGNGGGNGGAGGKGRIRFDMTSTPPTTNPLAFQGIPNPIAGVTYSWSTGATTNSIAVAPTSTSTYSVAVTSTATCAGLTSSQTIIVNPQTATLTVNTPSVCAGFTSTLIASGGGLIPNSVSNLVAYYRFDEGSGITANDLSGNVLTGTLVNTPVWSTSTASIFPSAGNSLTFNNSNTFVNIADAPIISTLQSSLTIEAWVYPTDNSNNTIIDRANDNFLFGTTFNGQSGIAFYNAATGWRYSTVAVPQNQWSHVAATWSYDGLDGKLTFYVNGVFSNQFTINANLTFGTGNMNIGRRQPTGCQCDYFNGRIDEVKIWNIPRTQAQLASQKNISLSSYVWSGGITNGVPFTPTTSATFTVSNQFGCATPITVLVSAPPIVVSGTNAVCPGTPVTLTASGANTYTWSNGSNSTNITVTPTVTTTYTVSGTAPNGCFLPIFKTVVLDVVPTISILNPGSIPNCSSTTLTATAPMLGTGGVITYSNGYAIHTFKSSDVFKMPFTGPVEVMVVAGGGGGGNDMGGGGGAGGVVYSSALTVNTGSYNVIVGLGGNGAAAGSGGVGTNGGNSIFHTLTAIGGGYGASRHNGNNNPASIGGSGGGASGGGVPAGGSGGANAVGTLGQGFAGGAGAGAWYPGGGGGAGGVGQNQPADGGPGIRYLSLSPFYFSGGGGGAGHSGNPGNGGIGGGGGGGAYNSVVSIGGAGINNGLSGGAGGNQPGGNAGANTGGGGGGGSHNNSNNKGGNGGSGIVIIKYLIPPSQTYSYLWSTGATTSSIVVSPTVNTTYSVVLTNTTGCTANSSVITLSVTPLNIAIINPGSIPNCSSATLTANAYGNPVVLTYSTVGEYSFVAPPGLTSIEYMVVAGGGGGGNDMGGGGGGGGVLYGTTTLTPGQTYVVSVGNGGNGAAAGTGGNGTNGGVSKFGTITAIGGGYGASKHNSNLFPANSGGSGGGASGGGLPAGGNGGINAAGIAGQGNAGGIGAGTWYPGGGGGAGGVGLSQPANGGPGIRYLSMSSFFFGGGGGGAGHDGNSGNGGIGGGGGGGAWNSVVSTGGLGLNNGSSGQAGGNKPGGNAGAATGGGGGGGSHHNSNNKGGDGGSGIVILKYNLPAVNTWSYTWSNGGANSQSIVISPTVNTSYSVTLTNPNGCSATSSAVTVSVNPLFIQINSPASIQNCNSATLSASAPIIGTGGNITTSGGYAIHTFTNVGASVFTPPAGVAVEYLVVAGGGGSGYSNGTGGGGGGGVLTGTTGILSSSAYTINVGAGGIGVNNGSSRGGNGSNSSAFTFTAIGGGGSGSEGSFGAGNSGGSGGGGVRGYTGGTGTSGQGFTGGSNVSDGAPHYSGGGGGGAGGAGTNGSASVVGVGGIGIQSSISGTAKYYGGGGGAGSYNNGSGQASSGAGGLGGGAMGGTSPSDGQNRNGLPNTGGGGAGYGIQNGLTCGNGGSGIVILRYLMPIPPSYSYAWSNGANTQTIVVSPSVTTTYSVVLTNTSGCVANSSPKTLSVTPLSIQITNPGSIPNCTSATLTATTPLLGTGGIITYTNGYAIHTFTSSGVFNLPSTVTATVLVVAGGGGGGMDMGGGGGGGGVVYSSSLTINAGTNSVVVGNGGTGAPAANTFGQPGGHQYTIPATNGQNSTFNGIVAFGGGRGGSSYWPYTPGGPGGNGGSGGGPSGYGSNSGQGAGLGTVGQGNNGGNAGGSHYSGGGGGAGSAGSGGTSLPHGGAGIQYPGISPFYFGGGGGGAGYSINGGNGGIGGGGGGAVGSTTGGVGYNNGSPGGGGSTGGNPQVPGGNAGANTGGGGGGGSHYNANNKGGEGGRGIVIIKYLIPTSAVVYNYTWSTGDTTQSIVVSPNSTTSYSVVLTTTAGCVANSSPITLSVTPLNIQIINPGTIPNCSSATLTAITMGDPVIVTYTNTGASTFSVPAGITNLEYLIVAGGGGAGVSNGTGGGGGGGVLNGTATVIPGQTYPINVGVGGSGAVNTGTTGSNGANSSAFSFTAIGGGGSGSEGSGANRNGVAGGSGGGGVRGGTGGSGTAGQGFAGGSNVSDGGPHYSGGGGGGAGGAGTNGTASIVGAGGIGIQSSISGTAKYYGGGGGAGSYNNGSGQASSGAGGLGGGAMGGTSPSDGQNRNGLPNTGGGGAGTGNIGNAGGNGGSGIVIVKYYLPSNNVYNYSWSTGATTQSIVVSPNSNTSYSVVLSNTAGCVANSSPITLSVTPLNFQITSTPSVICAGSPATLTTASSGTATGGVVSYSGGYTIHTFTANSTFSVTGNLPIEYLVVGGGGGSGGFGGGGGAGGLLAGSTSITSGSYSVVVGAGGIGETSNDSGGSNGGNSSIFTYTAIGGGKGRHGTQGTTGGSGGGNGYGANTPGGLGTALQGNNGGFCPGAYGGGYPGAGGGGAGGVGGNSSSSGGGTGGAGGAGFLSSISGTAKYYAVGGPGSARSGGTQGAAAPGGSTAGQVGAANTGNGAGGGNVTQWVGMNGGSGVVIVRYLTSAASATASLFSWSTGATSSSVIVTPSVTTTYSVTGTNTLGCIGTTVVKTVSVNPIPTVVVNSGTVCSGNTFSINASGAITYTYSGGSAVVSPTVSTDYTVTGTGSNGCTGVETSSVTVNPKPTITVNSGTICSGQSFTMVPSGASTYTYTGGSAIVSPTLTTSYSITGTSAEGCASSNTVISTVNVSPAPALTISGNATICAGSSATLSASSASLSSAIGGVITYSAGYVIHTFTSSATFSVQSSLNAEYLVVAGGGGGGGITGGGGGGGGVRTGSLSLSATNYSITVGNGGNGGIGQGNTGNNSSIASLIVSLGGGYGGSNGGISNGGVGGSGGGAGAANSSVAGGAGTVGQGYNGGAIGSWGGCYGTGGGGGAGGVGIAGNSSNAGNGGIGITSSISGISSYYGGGGGGGRYLCGSSGLGGLGGGGNAPIGNGLQNTGGGGAGQNDNNGVVPGGNGGSGIVIIRYLSPGSGPSSASTYTWSTGATTSSIIITPSVTTTYSVAGTSSIGCVGNTTAFTVSVTPIPTVAVSSGTICSGNSFTMIPSGATTYTYSSGTAVVSPTVSTNYTVTGSSINGCTDTEISSVTVNPKPILTVNSGTICSGQSFTMVPSGASTYTYTGGSDVVNPIVTTSYTITGTSALGCPSSNSVICNVNVSPAPALTVSGNATICAGNSATLSAGTSVSSGPSNAVNFDGADDYISIPSNSQLMLTTGWTLETWVKRSSAGAQHSLIEKYDWTGGAGGYLLRILSSGQVNAANILGTSSDAISGTTIINPGAWYHVAATFDPAANVLKVYVNGVLEGTNNAANLNPAPSTQSLKLGCYGNTPAGSLLNGSMDEARVWNTIRTQPQIAANMSVTIPSSSPGLVAYYQFNESSGLTTSDNSINSNIGTFTNGPTRQIPSTAPISGSGSVASSYAWSTGASTSSIVVTPSVTTTYSVVGTSSLGCVSNPSVFTVTVIANPTVAVSNATICNGNSFTLTPSGATTYTYSSGTAVVSPTVSTNYTVTGANVNGCIGVETSSITVNPKPILAVNSGTICSGQSFTMVPSGASTYTYSGGSAIVSPMVTTSYTLTGTSALGCPGTNSVISTVVVNATPTISVNSASICTGNNFTMTPSGASTYTYSSGSNVVNPLTNTTYSVNGTSAQGCISGNTAISSVTVNITPTISVNAGIICSGTNFTLTPSGANSYTYSGGSSVVSPMTSTTYSVSGISAQGCVSFNPAITTITVNTTPTVSVNSGVICTGNSFTMNPTGASTYTYSSGTNVVNPLINTTYSITGTSAQGCISANTAISSVTANITPTISVNAGVICTGNSFTLVPSGASTYTYSSGSNIVNPLINTTYSVNGTSAQGCVNVTPAVSTITVNITPTITVNSGIICSGNTFTLIPGGASTYTYSGGSNTVNPMVTTNYSVTGTSALGCVGFNPAITTITVNATPTISVNSGTICFGGTFTLTPTGAATYTYSSGTAVVNPTTTTTFSVSGTSLQGCPNVGLAVNTVTVRTLPVLVSTPTVSASNCITPTGAVNSVSVSGAATLTYSWTNSAPTLVGTSNNLINQPAGNYTLTATDGFGCKNTFGPYIIPNLSAPAAPTASATSNSVCTGNTINLFANTAGTGISYTWTGPNSFSSSTQNPTLVSATLLNNGVYNVFATAAGCVSSTSQVTVTVNTTPTVSVNSGVICTGNSFTMNPTGASTYTYSSGTNVVNPLINTTYSVTGTSVQGCISANAAISSVTANITPTISVNAGVICTGNSFTLIPSGAATYTYSSGSNVVNPLINTTYSVNGTSAQGCVNVTPAVSTITVNITPTITVNSGIICSGNTFTLIPGGASTYTYSGGSNTVNPMVTTNYSVTGTSALGCVGFNPAISTITVNATPTISVNSGTICFGGTFTLTPTGAATYTYSSGTATVSPSTTTSYSVSGTSLQGCPNVGLAVNTVTVRTLPVLVSTPTVSASNCITPTGAVNSVSVSGAATLTYSWTNSVPALVGTSNNLINQPAGNYTLTATDGFGCKNTFGPYVIPNLSAPAAPTASATSNSVCTGNTINLFANTAGTGISYTWTGPNSFSSSTQNPNLTSVTLLNSGIYNVFATAAGCVSPTSQVTVTVNTTPTVSVNSGVICTGNSFTMNPTGASTYTYSSGTNVVNPLINTTYSVTGTSVQGCISANAAISSVTANITPTISVNTGVICTGNSFTLIPNGAATYTYSSGSNVVNPLINTTYSVNGTSAQGCVNVAPALSTITVNITPTITVNSGVICSGGALSLIPAGAATYTYYGGGAATVSPSVSSTYSITGTSAEGCISSNTVVSTVLVLPLPIITVNSGTICSGETFTMIPAGAATYTFSSGTDIVSPTTTTSYTVTGTNSDGCTNTVGAISVVTVNALPSLTVSASSTSICSGFSSTLSVVGATSYTWNSGANTTSVSVTPSLSTTYFVSGTNALGCVNTSTQTVSLFIDPIINLTASSPTICAGLSANILASGVNSYTWSTGANTSSVNVSPIVNTTYSVNGTDVNGCSTYTTLLLGVSPTPTVNALGSSIGICIGSSANLSASGATTYTWNTGESAAAINVSPIINSTYTVVGTNGFGCSSTATVSLLAYSNPTVYIGSDIEVALGENYQFNPSQFGAAYYLWTGSDFLNSTTVINPITTPLNDIVYILTVTSIDGCVASDTISVKVLADLIIANYMSPNGDGVNDTWKLNVPLLIKNYSVDIIDSYNQKVFHADKNYNNDFDGKKNGENLPDGVYYYFIKDGSTLLYKGSITITR